MTLAEWHSSDSVRSQLRPGLRQHLWGFCLLWLSDDRLWDSGGYRISAKSEALVACPLIVLFLWGRSTQTTVTGKAFASGGLSGQRGDMRLELATELPAYTSGSPATNLSFVLTASSYSSTAANWFSYLGPNITGIAYATPVGGTITITGDRFGGSSE